MPQFDPRGLMEETRTSNCKYSQRQDGWSKEEVFFESGFVRVKTVLIPSQLEPTCLVQQVHAVTV